MDSTDIGSAELLSALEIWSHHNIRHRRMPVENVFGVMGTGLKITLKNGEKYLFYERLIKGKGLYEFEPTQWIEKIHEMNS